jgi:hypothetical protein
MHLNLAPDIGDNRMVHRSQAVKKLNQIPGLQPQNLQDMAGFLFGEKDPVALS